MGIGELLAVNFKHKHKGIRELLAVNFNEKHMGLGNYWQ
jgi:hypothetical protein